MERFEYRIEIANEYYDLKGKLHDLGNEGWELAGVIPGDERHWPELIFKRCKREEKSALEIVCQQMNNQAAEP